MQRILPVREMPRAPSGTAGFFLEVLRSPFETGALAPSSARLARRIVQEACLEEAASIVELGAGSGALTESILRARRPSARMIAIERSPRLAAQLEMRCPEAEVICDCATRLEEILERRGYAKVDRIISALPWSNLSASAREQVVHSCADRLAADGRFVTVLCFGLHWMETGRHVRDLLARSFAHVRANALLANFPPEVTYTCSGPR